MECPIWKPLLTGESFWVIAKVDGCLKLIEYVNYGEPLDVTYIDAMVWYHTWYQDYDDAIIALNKLKKRIERNEKIDLLEMFEV